MQAIARSGTGSSVSSTCCTSCVSPSALRSEAANRSVIAVMASCFSRKSISCMKARLIYAREPAARHAHVTRARMRHTHLHLLPLPPSLLFPPRAPVGSRPPLRQPCHWTHLVGHPGLVHLCVQATMSENRARGRANIGGGARFRVDGLRSWRLIDVGCQLGGRVGKGGLGSG